MYPGAHGFTRRLSAALIAAALLGAAPGADARMAPQDDEPEAAEKAPESTEPESAEWLVDDDGKRYKIQELKKDELRRWAWIDKNRIQVKYGLQFEVVDQDAEAFRVKIYERTRSAVPVPPTAEELERQRLEEEKRLEEAAASYRADLETVDRLRFEPFDQGLPRRGQWRNGFDVADMNADGHPDIVFGAPRKTAPARPHVFLGDGRGSWRSWREARYPALPYDYGDAAASDFNGDGHQDLALGMHLKGVVVLTGDGRGRFERWSEGIGLEEPGAGGDASTFSSRAIEAVDWNGDGRPDLLALGEGPKGIQGMVDDEGNLKSANGPIFFLNGGDGTWASKGYESKIFGDTLALGDYDGDGRLDFATASNTVGDPRILNLGRGADGWETRALAGARPGSYLRSVASGRLNADAVDDLVVGYVAHELGVWRYGVDVFYGSEDLEWQRRPLYAVEGKSGIYGLATGDLDGDGRRDVAFATGLGEVLVFLGDDSGFFVQQVSPEVPEKVPGCRGYGLRLSDLNGDGRDELIVAFAGERGDVALVGKNPYGCPKGGSLRVWSPAARQEAAPAAAGASRP